MREPRCTPPESREQTSSSIFTGRSLREDEGAVNVSHIIHRFPGISLSFGELTTLVTAYKRPFLDSFLDAVRVTFATGESTSDLRDERGVE